jgi:hypothetical protein
MVKFASRYVILLTCAACSSGFAPSDDQKAESTGAVATAEHDDDDSETSSDWPQWGQNPQHQGFIGVTGQRLDRQLANLVYDPFVPQEQAEAGGELLAHYQAPLAVGKDVFMEFETGTWIACDPPGSGNPPAGQNACGTDAWNLKIWNEKRLHWQGGSLVEKWSFASDWKPEPDAGVLGGWEPVFHGVVTNDAVYVPGAGGTVFKLSRGNGSVIARINPFGTIDPNTFVSGPLSTDSRGNVYYNVLQLDASDPYSLGPSGSGVGGPDVPGAWLVKISAAGVAKTVSYRTLVPGWDPTGSCRATFSSSSLPWPPSPTAVPRSVPCLSQRPGINITPAIAPDGTIYTVSVSHNLFASRYAYVIAVNPDLTPKWAASMRGHLSNGCNNDAGTFPGSVLPANGTPGGCRLGATPGVDPAANEAPAGRVIDQSSSSPVITPDGSVLYGSYARYNYARGNLFKFGSDGAFLAAYDFGWDSTPAVYSHDDTYSVVIKDNHYDAGSYCDDPTLCPAAPQGPYFITQLRADLGVDWKFQNTNTQSCSRNPDGSLTCTTTNPNGFEWCINAPAVDRNGVVYANSEDGNLYAIKGGVEKQHFFTNLALGAAYTPLSLGHDGVIYTENDGHLFVVGASRK